MRRAVGFVLIVSLIAGAGAAWYFTRRTVATTQSFRTAPVTRGDLRATISATGTVEPVEVIDVGAQVAGKVLEFGKDTSGKTIDYGSVIEEGTVLARIDDSLYAADFESAKAQLGQAKANLQTAEANVAQMQAKFVQAERDWNRAQKLGPSEALAPTTYDAYKSTYEVSKANVGAAQAAVEQAKASIAFADANLDRAQRLLAYCTIKSPVKGVVIDRRVNIGQTVVSSLNAPSLFLIARDLTRIQVWVSVNEADVGHVHAGQPVTFTVDSYPGKVFNGTVNKLRLNATMTQNVVTYTVEVNTDNEDGKLLPYLTANAQFEIGKRENVLLVPTAALRFTPKAAQGTPAKKQGGGGRSDRSSSRAEKSAENESEGGAPGTIWVQQDGALKPISITVGLSDGSMTEVSSDELKEGQTVVVADLSASQGGGGGGSGAAQAGGGSPFVTTPIRGGRGGGRG